MKPVQGGDCGLYFTLIQISTCDILPMSGGCREIESVVDMPKRHISELHAAAFLLAFEFGLKSVTRKGTYTSC